MYVCGWWFSLTNKKSQLCITHIAETFYLEELLHSNISSHYCELHAPEINKSHYTARNNTYKGIHS